MPRRPFLTARWEHIALLNYEVEPALVGSFVPAGTELDLWQDRCLVSLVGFRFLDTRLLGVPIPGHRDFDEVNLRFYVRRKGGDGIRRRAVVFIRELVPRWAIATVARWVYNEPYLSVPMSHDVRLTPEAGGFVTYGWRHRGESFALTAEATGPAQPLAPDSEAEFITEHYWAYTRQRDGGTLEYQVEHPPWSVWTPDRATCTGPGELLYGPDFGSILAKPPASAFLAVGSPVAVHKGVRLAIP
ncbi:MAG TPA: DUF2071 domain-containing protein [Thermoanaerobaculia bacterium]|jgi:uncharacterized protein YqjF (DUF2071 family)|nr:DUF2071 domain-containing protein [Thermoanaerobaculia bacterium]